MIDAVDDHGQSRSAIGGRPDIVRTRLRSRSPAADAFVRARPIDQLTAGAGRRLSLVPLDGGPEWAIEHHLATGQFGRAADAIAARWSGCLETKGPDQVLAWLCRLPDGRLESDRRLLLVLAWALSAAHRHDEAVSAIVRAAISPDDLIGGPLPDGLSSVESSLVLLRATHPRGDIGSALKAARRAVELEPADAPWRPAACLVFGLQLYRSDRLREAERWLWEAVGIAPGTRQRQCGCQALAVLSLVAGRESRLRDQHWLAERAEDSCRESPAADHAGEAHCALAASMAARRMYAEAVPLFATAMDIVRRRQDPLATAEVLLQHAFAADAAGDGARARKVLAEANELLDEGLDPGARGRRARALEARSRGRSDRPAQGGKGLSHRERVVLRLLAGDLPEREIGRELYLSFNTIHSHTKAIYRKLGVSSRQDALGRARVLGIL